MAMTKLITLVIALTVIVLLGTIEFGGEKSKNSISDGKVAQEIRKLGGSIFAAEDTPFLRKG
jgi:hypothetical protein